MAVAVDRTAARVLRPRLAAGLVALLGVTAGWAWAGQATAPPGGPITVAVILDLSGPGAPFGQAERIGVRLAEQEVAAAGRLGGRPLRLVVLDSATGGPSAARAATRAIEEERALVVVGSSTGITTLAVSDAAQRAEVPLFALAEGRPIAPGGGRPWVFPVPPGTGLVADALARDLARRRLTRVAWLEADGPIGAAGWNAFDAVARRHRLTVVARQRVVEGSDPSGPVGQVVGGSPQALVVWAIPPLAGAIAQVVADAAPALPHYQSHAAATGTFLPLAGAAAAGIRTVQVRLPVAEVLPPQDPTRARLLDFLGRIRSSGDGYPADRPGVSAFAGFGYDALHLAVEAIGRALSAAGSVDAPLARQRFDVREAVEGIRDYPGVSGTFSYEPGGPGGLDERALIVLEAVLPPGGKVAAWRPVLGSR